MLKVVRVLHFLLHYTACRLSAFLTFGLGLVAVALMLWFEPKVLMCRPKENLTALTTISTHRLIESQHTSGRIHIPDLDPIPEMITRHQRLQLISPSVPRRPILNTWWQTLQQAHWHIPACKTQPLQQEPPRLPNPHLITAPRLKPVTAALLHVLTPLRR